MNNKKTNDKDWYLTLFYFGIIALLTIISCAAGQ